MKWRSVVVLTGAGVSADSGIATFRDADGLWERHRIEDVASPQGFARNPALVQEFYNRRRRQLLFDGVQPNPAHQALAQLESAADSFLLVTQNIDDLHERAGSRNIIHMHGELLKSRCNACQQIAVRSTDIEVDEVCPTCGASGGVRPHVVWFGEMPLDMDEIMSALMACDLFLAVGTSGQVYPAAGFVDVARAAGAHTVEINLDPSDVASAFAERIYGLAAQTLPPFVAALTGDAG